MKGGKQGKVEDGRESGRMKTEKMEIKACRETADKCCFLWSS